MIVYVTSYKEIPENCMECGFIHCHLPNKQRGDGVQKKYQTRRHKECPLKELSGGKGETHEKD